MKILDPQFNMNAFWSRVAGGATRLLMLDYDGTLAPFRVKRDEAVPYKGVRDIMNGIISGNHTRVVIVSGRSISDIVPLLGLEPVPEIWGSHGWERMHADGDIATFPLPETVVSTFQQVRGWVDANGLDEHCELKHAAIAIHWRGIDPGAARNLKAITWKAWEPYSQLPDVMVKEFDGGLELRAAGRDKGYAVNTLLSEVDHKAAVAYLGDDTTDEDAFRAVKGKGCGVLVRREQRDTAAVLWLKPPEELLGFLSHWDHHATAA